MAHVYLLVVAALFVAAGCEQMSRSTHEAAPHEQIPARYAALQLHRGSEPVAAMPIDLAPVHLVLESAPSLDFGPGKLDAPAEEWTVYNLTLLVDEFEGSYHVGMVARRLADLGQPMPKTLEELDALDVISDDEREAMREHLESGRFNLPVFDFPRAGDPVDDRYELRLRLHQVVQRDVSLLVLRHRPITHRLDMAYVWDYFIFCGDHVAKIHSGMSMMRRHRFASIDDLPLRYESTPMRRYERPQPEVGRVSYYLPVVQFADEDGETVEFPRDFERM